MKRVKLYFDNTGDDAVCLGGLNLEGFTEKMFSGDYCSNGVFVVPDETEPFSLKGFTVGELKRTDGVRFLY